MKHQALCGTASEASTAELATKYLIGRLGLDCHGSMGGWSLLNLNLPVRIRFSNEVRYVTDERNTHRQLGITEKRE